MGTISPIYGPSGPQPEPINSHISKDDVSEIQHLVQEIEDMIAHHTFNAGAVSSLIQEIEKIIHQKPPVSHATEVKLKEAMNKLEEAVKLHHHHSKHPHVHHAWEKPAQKAVDILNEITGVTPLPFPINQESILKEVNSELQQMLHTGILDPGVIGQIKKDLSSLLRSSSSSSGAIVENLRKTLDALNRAEQEPHKSKEWLEEAITQINQIK